MHSKITKITKWQNYPIYQEITKYTKNKQIHRDKFKPALIINKKEQYFINDSEYKLSENKEYIINFNKHSNSQQEIFPIRISYKDNCFFSFLHQPTHKEILENGTVQFKTMMFSKYCVRLKTTELLHNYPEPAIIYPNGDTEYFVQGMRHRDDGPAVIYGNKHYYFRAGLFIKYQEV